VREYRQYIGGEWIGSAELFDDLDPYRGTVMARIPAGTRADAARAVDAAADAFPAWSELVRRAGNVPGARRMSCTSTTRPWPTSRSCRWAA
jgi:Aldehyde dehydrogenase family